MQLGDKKLLVQRASVGAKNAALVSGERGVRNFEGGQSGMLLSARNMAMVIEGARSSDLEREEGGDWMEAKKSGLEAWQQW